MKVLLIGGTGTISSAITRQLAAGGHDPTLVVALERAGVEIIPEEQVTHRGLELLRPARTAEQLRALGQCHGPQRYPVQQRQLLRHAPCALPPEYVRRQG